MDPFVSPTRAVPHGPAASERPLWRRGLASAPRRLPGSWPATGAVALGALAAWPWSGPWPTKVSGLAAVWFMAAALLPGAILRSGSDSKQGAVLEERGHWLPMPMRLVGSVAIAMLLGRAAAVWTLLVWTLALGLPWIASRWPEPLAGGSPVAEDGRLRFMSALARLVRPASAWRMWWSWAGPLLLSWLALGGDESLAAGARLHAGPWSQLLAWGQVNAAWPLVAMGLLLPLAIGGPDSSRPRVAGEESDAGSPSSQDEAETPPRWATRLSIVGWLGACAFLAALDHPVAAMGGLMLLAGAWPALIDPVMPRTMARRRRVSAALAALALAGLAL